MNTPLRRSSWAAFPFFAAAAVAMTWPLAGGLARRVSDPGDPYLNAWILRWDWRQLLRDPFHLFDGNIFHPARLTLAFSENLFGVAVFGFPLDAAGFSPVFVYNVLLILGMALSGFAAWALAREMTGDASAALVAGVFYAFAPFRFSQLPHVQMQWGPFLPLFLLYLWRYLSDGRSRDLALYALFFAWNAIACVHYGVFGAMALVLTAGLELTRRRAWRSDPARRLLRATGVAIAAVLPFAIPYFRASRLYHFRRGLGEIVSFSASPKAFLSAGMRSKVWGAVTARFSAPEADLFMGVLVPSLALAGLILSRRTPGEGMEDAPPASRRIALLDGLIAILAMLRIVISRTGSIDAGPFHAHEPYRLSMALFAAVAARLLWRFPRRWRHRNFAAWLRARRCDPAVAWSVAMIVLGVVVALGGRFFLYRELYEIFRPVLGSIRAPSRGIVLAHLGLGVLAALGVSALRVRLGGWGRSALPFAAAALALVELRAAPISWFEEDPSPPPAIAWMQAQGFSGAVLELPMKLEDNFPYVLWAASHDFPIVNGYSGFFPKAFEAVQAAFVSRPVAAGAAALLAENDVRAVLLHRGRSDAAEQEALSRFLSGSVASGALIPVRMMGKGAGETAVLVVRRYAGQLASSSAERAAVMDALAHPMAAPIRPQGWYFEPQNGAVFHGSTVRGSGWAAAEDGMERVEVLLDGRNVGPATYGLRRPEVPMVLPRVPCREFCGYAYRIDHVAPGRHELATRYVGRNGGTATPPAVEIWVR